MLNASAAVANPFVTTFSSASSSPSATIVNDLVYKRPSCLIIYTGGTIGMQRNADGTLAPSSGYLLSTLRGMPELLHSSMPSFDVLEWPQPLDSSDFTANDITRLCHNIADAYYNHDGFVILHGTDTLAYTASALSFMLSNLNKTVILTGSMIPLSAPVSDAKRNLIISLLCAVHIDVPEVCVFFNSLLTRGNRTRKVSPNSVNAFASPNFPPLAEMGVHIHVNRELVLTAPRRRFTVHSHLYTNIACITITPLSDVACIRAFLLTSTQANPAALVLSLYGTGGAPVRSDHAFIRAVRDGADAGAVIVVLTQCYHGRIDLSQYESGALLKSFGVIDGGDMTVECAVTKLSVLMGRGLRSGALRAEMERAQRGELTVKNGIDYGISQNDVVVTTTPPPSHSTRGTSLTQTAAAQTMTPRVVHTSESGSITSKL